MAAGPEDPMAPRRIPLGVRSKCQSEGVPRYFGNAGGNATRVTPSACASNMLRWNGGRRIYLPKEE